MEFISKRLTCEEVLDLLKQAENSFSPPLSHNIPYTLHEYAEKLASNAMFVICLDQGKAIGFMAYYINIEGKFSYIPQIWVSDFYQRKGIGTSMVHELICSVPSDIRSIRLEVRESNLKALSFYLKSGYVLINKDNGKCLMEKMIER